VVNVLFEFSRFWFQRYKKFMDLYSGYFSKKQIERILEKTGGRKPIWETGSSVCCSRTMALQLDSVLGLLWPRRLCTPWGGSLAIPKESLQVSCLMHQWQFIQMPKDSVQDHDTWSNQPRWSKIPNMVHYKEYHSIWFYSIGEHSWADLCQTLYYIFAMNSLHIVCYNHQISFRSTWK
jgi:hypothetical protein